MIDSTVTTYSNGVTIEARNEDWVDISWHPNGVVITAYKKTGHDEQSERALHITHEQFTQIINQYKQEYP